jgi:CRP-like cAMP-binding protein
MISPELLRRYPFFAGLSHDQIVTLAQLSEEISVEKGHHFFHEGHNLHKLYLVVKGSVSVCIEVPDPDVKQGVSEQLLGELKNKCVTVSTVGSGNIFGWSALVPPYDYTACAEAMTPCRIIAINCEELPAIFEQQPEFGYLMSQKAAQVIRNRLRDMRIESLAATVA